MHLAIDLLKHPYPYKCSFTICNDCDYITRETFEAIHQFINTTDNTRLGKGLGLPIADSMFVYTERPGGLSYFKDLSGTPGRDSDFLKDVVKEGWVDSLHGYGDFMNPNVFSRTMAEKALEELEKNNIKLKVWIDHGSGDNSQNFGLPNFLSRGDNPGHKAYHTDLLKAYGIIFIADYNTDRLGQNGKRKYVARYMYQPEVSYRGLKRLHGRFYGRRLLRIKSCRDNNPFWFFSRARNGVLRPDASTLSYQLSDENVEKLIQSGGTMVLYQHLGSVRQRSNEFPFLDQKAKKALENIAEKYHRQIIWVAPTSELLTNAYLVKNLELCPTETGDGLSIDILDRNNSSSPLGPADLKNFSFRIKNYEGDRIILKHRGHRFQGTEYEIIRDDGIIVKLRPGINN